MIKITQGDYAVLQFTATDGNGNPIDLTGATFSTQIKGPNGVIVTFPDSQHDVPDAPDGIFTLTLSPTDTASLGEGAGKTVITTITIGGNPVNYNGFNALTVYPNVPLQ